MRLKTSLVFASILFAFTFCTSETYKTKTQTDANGYKYETFANDPYGVRLYTLDNGLTVYLSVNEDEPRIQSFIAVKAGSTYDPIETTGLAHYLEHMMFKGTPKMGTTNWEAEEPLIKELSELFEAHKNEPDAAKKKVLYAKIDSVSQLAAQYVAPNEYDQLIQSIGGTGTNAYTSNERTVYINNIPSNELDKWLQIEGERFFNPVLRVFHTELETVYEEFNMSQDNDSRKAYYAMLELAFPNHPYGQQTTLGKAEHLKNPSMENILNYQHTYYVPNNMAVCLSGDLDPDKTIQLIDKYFGAAVKEASTIPEKVLPKEEPITEVKEKEVFGPQAAFMYMAYRFDGVGSEDEKMVTLIDYMLSNAAAGLIDLDLNQQQKVLRAGCGPMFMKEYGLHYFFGMPRQGQTLEEVKALLLEEVEKIKAGDFEDWLIEASINNMKLDEMQGIESNQRAHIFAQTFTDGVAWPDHLKFNDELSTITKEQIMAFAQERYTDNYVVAYKRQGNGSDVVKIDKPQITPVDLNRTNQSEFAKSITAQATERMQPVYADFEGTITHDQLAEGVNLHYIKNKTNELFKLDYIIDMGGLQNRDLALAIKFLPFLGTDKYTAAELQQEFFKYGLSFNVSAGKERSYVTMSGLEENVDKAVELLEHILAHVQPDSAAYSKYVDGVAKSRMDQKANKNAIIQGLLNYGKYGAKSYATDVTPLEDLRKLDPAYLCGLIKEMTSYEHLVFYYGQKSEADIKALLQEKHTVPAELKAIPEAKVYPELPIEKTKVYFVDYDMVQTQFLFLSKDEKLNNNMVPKIRLFNEFYGSGLSSIVFQEIREARALAYSAYSYFTTPDAKDKSHYNYSFVATQADKLETAANAMHGLLQEIPEASSQFEVSKDAIMKQIETERIIKDQVFWTWLDAQDVELDHDIRKDVYDYMQKASMDDFEGFFNAHVKGKPAVMLVMGKRELLDMDALKKVGPLTELSLEELFGY